MATSVGDLYINLKLDIKDLKAGVKRSETELKKLSKSVKKTSKSISTLTQTMVRHIRMLESMYVAYRTVTTLTETLIGRGIELNKMYEDQALGIAALTSAKLKMFDATGEELSSYEQFVAAQQLTKDVMEDIKKAALETPASFQQMVGFYQQAIGHAITENKTFGESLDEVNKNVITFTQRMSALGSAAGMEMTKINEEIRSLMSGNASTDSLLAMMLFGSPSAANKAVKEAKTRTNGLSTLLLDALKPFENVEGVQTYSKTMAQLNAEFDDLRRQAAEPIFQDIQKWAEELKATLGTNMEKWVQSAKDFYTIIKHDVNVELKLMDNIVSAIGELLNAALPDGVKKIIDEVKNGNSAWDVWINYLVIIQKGLQYLEIGVRTITNAFYQANQLVNKGKQMVGLSGSPLSDQQNAQLAALNRIEETQMTEYQLKLQKELTEQKREANAIDANNVELQQKIEANREKIVDLANTSLADLKKGFAVAIETADVAEREAKAQEDNKKALLDGLVIKQKGGAISEDNEKKAKKAGAAAAKATRLADKQAKELMQMNEEMAKQELLRYKISLERGKLEFNLKSKSLRMYEEEAELAKAVEIANAKLVKGTKSAVQLEKDKTKALEAEYELLKKMTAEMSRWENVFANIFSGDLAGAINGIFGDMFEGLTKSISSFIGGTMGAIVGGFTGALINLGLDILQGMFTSGKVWTPDEYKESIGAVTVPESDAVIELLSSIDESFVKDLKYSKGMYENLKVLAVQSGKAAVAIDSAFSFKGVDKYTPGALGGLWGGTQMTTLFSGLELEFNALAGAMANTLEVTQKTKTSWFGLRKKTTVSEVRNSVDQQTLDAINAAYQAGIAAMLNGATALGVASAEEMVSSFQGTMHKLDFEGKSQEEISAMITGAISADLDAMVMEFASWVTDFARAGESAFETFGRIAVEFEYVSTALGWLGKEFKLFGDGSKEVADTAIKLADTMVQAAGGIDAFADAMSTFIDRFYSEGEKFNIMSERMFASMKDAGVSMEFSKDSFRELMESIDVTTEEGAALYGTLLKLADEFADFAEANEAIAKKIADAAEESLKRIEEMKEAAAKEMEDFADMIMKRNADEIYAIYKKLMEDQIAFAKQSLNFNLDVMKRIEDAYAGTLSYLTALEKTEYFNKLAESKFEQGDTAGYFDALSQQLNYEKAMSTSREDYILKFESYINKLQNAEEPTTLTDVNETLEEILEQNHRLEYAISKASYQGAY